MPLCVFITNLLCSLRNNLDLFFINTSVFFFAINFLQSKRDWKIDLLLTTPETVGWGKMENIATFIEHQNTEVDAMSLLENPKWLIKTNGGKTMTAERYMEEIFIPENYDEKTLAYRRAGEYKARIAAFFGGALLLIGSYVAIYKNCDNALISFFTLSCYIVCAILLINLFLFIVSHLKPQKPMP